ncbi:MAG: acetolactate synthase [Methanobrevibacter sp.]|nr:acetolactate synthase [Methanobrevibacter sp.]
MIKQLSIFVENKEGRLKKAIDTISMVGVNIRALSIADTSKFGILRLIVQDISKTKKVLEENNFIVKETDVLAVEIPDEAKGLNKILNILDKSKINLEYLYAFVSRKDNQAIVIISVENIEEGLKALNEENVNVLSQKDIETFKF